MYDYRTTDLVALHIFKKQQLEELFNGNVPSNLLEGLEDNPRNNVLLEWLNTHNAQELIYKLHKEFGNDIEIEQYNLSQTKTILRITRNSKVDDFTREEKFINIIDAYGYTITSHNGRFIFLSPKTSDSANQLVYEKCHGVVYHLTDAKNAYSISTNGLRIKSGQCREYTKRTFCFVAPPENNYDIKQSINDVLNELRWSDTSNLVVVKINLGGHNVIDFYKDDAMRSDITCYTFTNIPVQYIKWIKPLSELC